MGDSKKTKQTTTSAIARITKYLEKNDQISALFLCYVYGNIRLKSILARKLAAPDDLTSRENLNNARVDFSIALSLCRGAGLITEAQFTDLRELQKKRNSLAHESILWRELEKTEIPSIERTCRRALRFLQDTTAL